jgi:hypothetical protein
MMEGEVRGWFAGAWVCLLVLAALAIGATPSAIVVCDATLTRVTEPSDWRSWPLDSSEAMGHGACAAFMGAAYGGCPSIRGDAPGTWIRHAPGGQVFVVAGLPGRDQAPNERFLAALQRTPGRRLALVSRGAAACLGFIGLGLVVMVAGLLIAHRRQRMAALLASSVWGAYAELASDPPTYRRPPLANAPASVELCLAEGAREAKRALATAFVSLAVIVAVFVVGAGYFVLGAWLRFVL